MAIEVIDLDLQIVECALSLCMSVCSQMSLTAVDLKSPLRITHLKFSSEWSGGLK